MKETPFRTIAVNQLAEAEHVRTRHTQTVYGLAIALFMVASIAIVLTAGLAITVSYAQTLYARNNWLEARVHTAEARNSQTMPSLVVFRRAHCYPLQWAPTTLSPYMTFSRFSDPSPSVVLDPILTHEELLSLIFSGTSGGPLH